MAETPDFDAIARRLIARVSSDTFAVASGPDPPTEAALVSDVLEQLRQMWNARGAADIAKLETELVKLVGAYTSGRYVKALDRAVRALDR